MLVTEPGRPIVVLATALTVPTVLVIILGIQGLVIGACQIIGGFKGGGIGPFILGATQPHLQYRWYSGCFCSFRVWD